MVSFPETTAIPCASVHVQPSSHSWLMLGTLRVRNERYFFGLTGIVCARSPGLARRSKTV